MKRAAVVSVTVGVKTNIRNLRPIKASALSNGTGIGECGEPCLNMADVAGGHNGVEWW